MRVRTVTVYTIIVRDPYEEAAMLKNITLSADDKLIEAARERARAEHTTLNEQFRRWLAEYSRRGQQAERAMAAIRELQGHLHTDGRRFTRDEMNER